MLTTMGSRELNAYFKGPLFCGEVLDVHSCFAIILPRKRGGWLLLVLVLDCGISCADPDSFVRGGPTQL